MNQICRRIFSSCCCLNIFCLSDSVFPGICRSVIDFLCSYWIEPISRILHSSIPSFCPDFVCSHRPLLISLRTLIKHLKTFLSTEIGRNMPYSISRAWTAGHGYISSACACACGLLYCIYWIESVFFFLFLFISIFSSFHNSLFSPVLRHFFLFVPEFIVAWMAGQHKFAINHSITSYSEHRSRYINIYIRVHILLSLLFIMQTHRFLSGWYNLSACFFFLSFFLFSAMRARERRLPLTQFRWQIGAYFVPARVATLFDQLWLRWVIKQMI